MTDLEKQDAAFVLDEDRISIVAVRRTSVDGVIVQLDVRVDDDAEVREVAVPVAGVVSQGTATTALQSLGLVLTPTEGKAFIEWLALRSRSTSVPTLVAISQPKWDGDRLLIPGVNAPAVPGALALPAFDGDEDEAATAWRYIVTQGSRFPKLGLLLGAVAMSPYLERVGVKGSVYENTAESTKGKTQTAETAMCVFGPPDHELLRGNWNSTVLGFAKTFARNGCIPILLDETGTANPRQRDTIFGDVVFMVNDGIGRTQGTKDGGMRTDARFCLNVISTGEDSLVTSGRTGAFARVHELRFPLTDDPDEIEDLRRARGLAEAFAGYPLAKLLALPVPTRAELPITLNSNPLVNRHSEALAAARLGFQRLAAALGLELDIDLTQVFAEIGEDMSEAPASARLREALWNDYTANPTAYEDLGGIRGYRGKKLDGRIAYFKETVVEVAARTGVGVDPMMRELRDQGVLDPEGTRLQKMVRVGNSTTRMYVLWDLNPVSTEGGNEGDVDPRLTWTPHLKVVETVNEG